MTTIREKLNLERIDNFKSYLDKNQITLTHAAELLGISKGQLSHLLKTERSLSYQMYNRMGEIIKGKRPQTNGGIYGLFYENKLIYIGQTINFSNRWYEHKNRIKHKINDSQPLHSISQLDVNKIIMKILYNCENTFLYSNEISRLEEMLIRVCLPEWNSNIKTLSAYKIPKKEKIKILADFHQKSIENLSKDLEDWKIKLTETGEEQVYKAINYDKEETLLRATIIVSRWKNLTEEDIKGE